MTFLPGAGSHPDSTAIVCDGTELTWGQLESAINRYANAITARGLQPGDAVAVLAWNRIEFVIVLLGNLRAGLRHVPVNWHLTADEVAYVLEDSGARLLVADEPNAGVATAAARQAGVDDVLMIGVEFQQWLAEQSDHPPANTRAGFALQYTSGTTGRQKGVLRKDRAAVVDQIFPELRRVGGVWGFTDGGTHLVVCPLYHATPPGHVLFALAFGQTVVLDERFDAERTLELVECHRVTTLNLVPTQLIRLLRLPDESRSRYDTSSLVGIWHGAASCPAWAKQAAIDWFGPILIEYFGSSEGTGPVLATSQDWLDRPGTVGRPAPWLVIVAVDDEGHELPAGEVGTLYFRRPEGPPEYLGAPERTAGSRRPDGSFTVGDVGWLDDDGFLYLADRKVDLIISGGVNIYPRETEGVLLEHPDVVDAAVFGIPDSEWGEQVKAAVQLRPGADVGAEELIAFCLSRIAKFKCPRSVDFHERLPREASGKLKKHVLRAQYVGVEQSA